MITYHFGRINDRNINVFNIFLHGYQVIAGEQWLERESKEYPCYYFDELIFHLFIGIS